MKTITANSYVNISILATANVFAFLSMPLVIFIASLIGAELSGKQSLATIPVATTITGIAIGIWPASKITALFGRKACFISFLLLGSTACLIASIGITENSFGVFCAGVFLLGISNAAIQQFRYAAIECLGTDKAATAASIVLSGGIIAALAGPELALIGKDLTNNSYQGSFWLAAICLAIAAVIIGFFKVMPTERKEMAIESNKPKVKPLKKSNTEVDDNQSKKEGKPSSSLLTPAFCLAICSGAVSYFVMSFIMTATPISMHHHFMYSLTDTKFVIQSHILAMFLPSLISPLLFRWFGINNMMKLGLFAYAITITVGYFYTSLVGFWIQLIFLGIGWNFLFVAGTAMLPTTHSPENKLKAQAINDGLIFGLQAIASVSAGIVMAKINWAGLISIGLVPICLLIALMIWNFLSNRDKAI